MKQIDGVGKLTEKQLSYIRDADKRWNFKVGATRSGKTFVDIRHVIPKQIRIRTGLPGLTCIMGVTVGSIERNILAPMREVYGEEMVHKVDGWNMCKLFNETVYVIGAEKNAQMAKLRGASFKYVYGDEVAEWGREVFELLKSRLDKPYSRFDGTCNPEGPGHWLKGFLDKSAAFVQYFHIDDNPYLNSGFVAELKKEYEGTVYYGRYIEGRWTAADGMVYPKFGKENIIDRIDEKYERYVISVDYGIQNATVMLLFGCKDGKWVAIDEFYHSGRESGMACTDEEYYDKLCKLTKRNNCGIDCIIIDPSAASFIQLIRKKGEYAVKRADNEIIAGIRNTASALSLGQVKIHIKCRRLLNEIVQYAWDGNESTEKPKKENDHACDALRYFVRTMRII
ncbi:MAG: PBSX family phage terminase large subunit [Defluviitaleaceae bacterium]|nr:PBSX family phage terminase large subunit [Defluviitaleaceae bacterium]MCL2835185.1 PBSX family phage terminase large subunit [Defluviitaleaceae bacterium]